MNELALFSGAGGGILGTRLLGWRVVCAVEIDAYCREVLLRRQEEDFLPAFPIWDDVRTFDGEPWRGIVDVVTAGFPCQPWSVAGKQQGESDERNLWPDTIRVIREVQPTWCLLENVPALLAGSHGYYGQILRDLVESGYDVRWDCIPASAVGAPHRRDRFWIVAYRNCMFFMAENSTKCNMEQNTLVVTKWNKSSNRSPRSGQDVADAEARQSRQSPKLTRREDSGRRSKKSRNMADTDKERLQGSKQQRTFLEKRCAPSQPISQQGCTWWDTDPAELGNTSVIRRNQNRNEADKESNSEQEKEGGVYKPFRTNRTEQTRTRSTQPCLGRVVDELADRLDFIRTAFGGQIPRVVIGVKYRVDRLKALGNGQVPGVVRAAWRLLSGQD